MANKLNNFPPAGLPVSAGIKALNRDPRTSSGTGYYVTDALSIDFRIQGFVTDNSAETNAHITEYKKDGVKFIIDTTSIPSAIIGSYESGLSGGYGALAVGDVVVWNGAQGASGQWELWYDASSVGVSGTSGGAFGYVVEENQFYGYFGDVRGWDTVGVGNTGPKGDTGPDALVGAKYVQQANVAAVNAEGKIRIENDDSQHAIRIHRNAAGLNGFAGATSDLINVFFPNGVSASNDATNPKVVVSFYNDTIDQTFAIRASLKAAAIQDTNELLLDVDTASSYNSFEVLSSTSGSGSWSGTGVAWAESDEIYVLALSDGVAGTDGTNGTPGVTGQGITFGANVAGELNIQYLDENGNTFGNLVPTGIVDGATGDPGEVGFLLAATGSCADLSPIYWGNDTDGDTGSVQPGEIYYTNVGGEKIIAIHHTPREGSSATPFVFGFTAGDLQSGTEFENKKGSLYFYEQLDKTLLLRSFLKYTQAKCLSSPEIVLLKGITDTQITGVSDAERLGITLDGSTSKDIFTLISPDGLRGTGITFGAIVDNKLFLDYVDENGNTFGRFESVEGVSGDVGGMNPFNIPYVIGGSAGGSPTTGQLRTSEDEFGALETLSVNATAGSNDFVADYVEFPVSPNSQNKSGFLTVFSTTSVEDFGVFRFTTGSIVDTSSPLNRFVTYGSAEKPLQHVGGNITQIVGPSPTGFPVGTNVLFAINTDGAKGAGGSAGAGFTYGNEYFITNIAAKPEARTDGTELEIGDKWFCTDVGLEFTYLGVSGDGFVNTVAGPGTGPTGDGDYPVVWVQTNNARQGQQGPRGDRGINGLQGNDGATGIDTFSTWSSSGSYDERTGVYVTRQQCLLAGVGNENLINANWDLLNSGAGATNGFFVVKTGFEDVGQIPGLFNLGSDWNSVISKWSPVVTNTPGVPGSEGGTGPTGDSLIKFVADEQDDGRVFLDAHILPEGGDPNDPDDVIITNILDSSNNEVNFRGPTGPSGNLVGSNNEIVFIKGNTGEGTNAAIIDDNSGNERLVLRNYREETISRNISISDNLLTLDCNEPVVHLHATSNETINSVNLNNCSNPGDGTTIYIHQDGGTVTWNANQATEYLRNNSTFDKVFVSSQGFPTPGKIEFGSGATIGAFTFKYIVNSPSTLVINYVQFVTPE